MPKKNLNKKKGELLEKIVAALYKSPGLKVEQNVKYPTTDRGDTREIDVLVTTHVAGLPVEYAFQCKNEEKPIGINKMGEFVAALQDIGIPTKYGIFVSVNGFTKPAIRQAKKNGIRTLVLRGLTEDRLKHEIGDAIQHNIFLIPRINQVAVLNNVAKSEFDWQFLLFFDENQNPIGSIIDLIYNKWLNGEISNQLGEHQIELEVPTNWYQFHKGDKVEPLKITAELSILAAVIEIEGRSRKHLLFDAETDRIEKFKLNVDFKRPAAGETIQINTFYSDEELNEALGSSVDQQLRIKTQLPRLISSLTYYPLSKSVSTELFDLPKEHRPNFENLTQEEFNEKIYTASKNDMFEKGFCNFLGKPISVILRDNNSDLVDVTLLAECGEYEQIISFKEQLSRRSDESFVDIMAWAFKEKGREILRRVPKAQKVKKQALLKDSLENIQKSLQLNPESDSTTRDLATIFFDLGEYKKSLDVQNTLFSKGEAEFNELLLRLRTFIQLEEWKGAARDLRKLEKWIKREKYEHANPIVFFYRAEILTQRKKYKLAWKKLHEVWQASPEQIVSYSASTAFIDKVVREHPTVEGRFFLIEVLYFRASEFLRIAEFENATGSANSAFNLLDDVKLLEQMDKEPIATGSMEDSQISGVLARICDYLRSTENSTFEQNELDRISAWYKKTYGKRMNLME